MKDASYPLRVGYMTALGGLSFKGQEIVSHDEIKPYDDDSSMYIVVSGQTFDETSLKCGFETEHIISLNIVCKYALGSGTKKDSEDISNEVLSRVYPSTGVTGVSISEGFNIWKTRLVGSRTLVEETSDERIITKILTFQHSISEVD